MLKDYIRILNMLRIGLRYVNIFKKTYFHPFISLKQAYKQLSIDRQNYSNTVLEYLNIKVEIVGKLPQEDKILYAINHRSLLDIIIMENIFSTHNKSGAWIAKQELFDDPVYGKFFQYSGCISVDVENKKGLIRFFKMMKKTLTKVSDMNIFIFPEGGRNKEKGIMKFQSGADKIAKANKLKIVPVFINEELENIFRDSPYTEQKTVKVHIGNIITEGTLESNYHNFMQDIITNS